MTRWRRATIRSERQGFSECDDFVHTYLYFQNHCDNFAFIMMADEIHGLVDTLLTDCTSGITRGNLVLAAILAFAMTAKKLSEVLGFKKSLFAESPPGTTSYI